MPEQASYKSSGTGHEGVVGRIDVGRVRRPADARNGTTDAFVFLGEQQYFDRTARRGNQDADLVAVNDIAHGSENNRLRGWIGMVPATSPLAVVEANNLGQPQAVGCRARTRSIQLFSLIGNTKIFSPSATHLGQLGAPLLGNRRGGAAAIGRT
jgi:hypothetical protein